MTPRTAPPSTLVVRVALVALFLPGLACRTGVEPAAPQAAGGAAVAVSNVMTHEPCNVASVEAKALDADGDGKPDLIRVFEGDRELCRVVDLNHDGKPDEFIYFAEGGAVRRKEFDFDRDGRLDEIDSFEAGELRRKDRETNLDGKLDTFDYFEGGKLVRRERDTDADGRVDQWWRWADAERQDCPIIEFDRDVDGKADPGSAVDVCAEAEKAATGEAPAAVSPDGGVEAGAGAKDGGAPPEPPRPVQPLPPPPKSSVEESGGA